LSPKQRAADEQMLAKVRELVVPSIRRHSPIEAWIVDDPSFSRAVI
jgi:hypothetical protein